MNSLRLFNSNLRYKTALYFSLGLAGMIISFLFISRYFFLYSLNELENMEISRANNQAHAVIEMFIDQQEERSYDWAHWDETYYLLKNGNVEAYRTRNLYLDTLDTLGLDLMAFIPLEGNVLDHFSRENDPKQSSQLVTSLMQDHAIAQHITDMNNRTDGVRESTSNLFKVANEIWMVSLTPVRNSEANLASPGWLLWGANLTSRFPGNFQSILIAKTSLTLNRPAPLEQTDSAIELAKPILRQGEKIIQWSTIIGPDNTPVAFLKTEAPREHFVKSKSIFAYLFAVVGISTTLIATSTFLFFRKGVAIRFNAFEKGINQLFDKYQLEDLKQGKTDELDRATQLVEVLTNNALLAEDKVQDTLQKYRALYDSQSVGLLVVLDDQIMDVNQKALELLGYAKENLICQSLQQLCTSTENNCQVDMMYHQLAQGQLNFEAQLLASNNDVVDCQLEAAMIQHNGQNALLLLIHDVRTQKQQEQLIKELSGRDPISGLKNRPMILNEVKRLIETQPNRFSFMYISIEKLKNISAVYGHLVFDDAIRYAASALNELPTQYKVGRISEFEFIVVIPPNSDCYYALNSANKLIDKLAQKTEISGLAIDLNCKVVMVEPKLTHHSLAYLLQAAYYTAQIELENLTKEAIIMGEKLSEHAQVSLMINRDLELAVANEKIGVHYQPIIDTQTGEINGFEALARWFHPTLGIVSPGVFIPVAEQSQLIVQLGESVLYQACEFIVELNQTRSDNGLKPLTMHVNLSAKHFYHTCLADYLRETIDKFKLETGQLVLELTESMLMGVEAETINRMNEIKQLGVQLALDDFGTGYASFSTLCSFPLDIVKLDKSYIDQIENNERAKTLLRSIANMAQDLGLTTVAEGVETSSQVNQLKEWNIDEIQGFYFYKPMNRQEATGHFATFNS